MKERGRKRERGRRGEENRIRLIRLEKSGSDRRSTGEIRGEGEGDEEWCLASVSIDL